MVLKSISGIRSIVRPLDNQRATELDRVRDLSTQFQELVEGVDVRVHVVGQQIFATEIRSPVVENRTDIEGGIRSRTPHPSLNPYDVRAVAVDGARPVEGYADLLTQRVGSVIDLNVKRSLLPDGDVSGWSIRCRADVGGPGEIFAESDPAPDRFSVSRP